MDLIFNSRLDFTKWAVARGLPRDSLVVIDVGVQGGEHRRWNVFGDRLLLHGFDAIRDVVEGLEARGRPNRHYHWMAIGDRDGETQLFFNAADPYSSSLYSAGPSAYNEAGARREEVRTVPIRRLDALLDDGTIPLPDFLKVDVEGFEKAVFEGASRVLASPLLAFEVETSFGASSVYPATHFGTLLEFATQHGFRVYDLNYNRIPTASFQHALEMAGRRPIKDQRSVGKICTMNVLFCRDPVGEANAPNTYVKLPAPLAPEKLVKLLMLLESYGLNDIAIDVLKRFENQLAGHLDVASAIRLLADPDCRLDEELNLMLHSISWKITAPLRAARRLLRI